MKNAKNASPLILFAHGSREAKWVESLNELTKRLKKQSGKNVALAFMELATPDLQTVVASFMRQGFSQAKLLPLFLAEAGHVTRDIPSLVATVEAVYPEFQIEILPALGSDPHFFAMLLKIISGV